MELWNIQREWEGQTCAVMASGPSMSYSVSEQVRSLGLRTIAVNNQGIDVAGIAAMSPDADILYAADQLWWMHNRDAALAFKGRKVTIEPTSGAPKRESEDVLMVGNGGAIGFDDRTTHIKSGGNSGYQAIHVAAHLGAKRILLFGFDMHCRGGYHWFGIHKWRDGHKPKYELFMSRFETLAPELKKREIEVLNCTVGSKLTCFTKTTLDEVVRNGLQSVRQNAPNDSIRNRSRALSEVGSVQNQTQVGAI